MLKTIMTVTGKFTRFSTRRFEMAFSSANLADNSFQLYPSFCFVHNAKPESQSPIALSRATYRNQASVQILPSFNGFVYWLASIFKSGRVTSGSTRIGANSAPTC